MYCKNCGYENDNQTKYCKNCNFLLNNTSNIFCVENKNINDQISNKNVIVNKKKNIIIFALFSVTYLLIPFIIFILHLSYGIGTLVGIEKALLDKRV